MKEAFLTAVLPAVLTLLFFYIALVAALSFFSDLGLSFARRVLSKVAPRFSAPHFVAPPIADSKGAKGAKTPAQTKEATWREGVWVFLLAAVSRVSLYIFAQLFGRMKGLVNGNIFQSLEKLWSKWDGPHYISIAAKGYLTTGDERNFIVFYPFYPALIRVFGALLGGKYFIAAVLISVITFSLGCVFLYKIVLRLWGEEAALRSVVFACIVPATHFFAAPMTEGLFFLLSILSVYYILKHDFIVGGIFGAFAAATRNFGLLLVIPLVSELIILKPKQKTLGMGVFGAALILCGGLSYLLLNEVVTGDMFTFLQIQKEHWHQEFQFLYKTIKNSFVYAFTLERGFHEIVSLWLPQIFYICGVLIIMAVSLKALPTSLSLYSVAYIFVALSPSWLMSGARYLLTLFPLYICMAYLSKNKFAFYISLLILAPLMLSYLGMYLSGWAVM